MYLDLIVVLNFLFDFLLLLSVSIVLRRNVKIKRIIIGSMFGTILLVILLFNFNSIMLIIIKFLLSLLMLLITFGYKDIKYFVDNIFYFYINSFLLGGVLYLLKIQTIKYLSVSILNIFDYGVYFIFLVIFTPLIIYIYTSKLKKLKNHYSLNYKVTLFLNNKKINLNGYLDTGNTVIDPYKKRGVIITNNKTIKKYIKNNNYFLIPYDTIDSHGLLKCIRINKIFIKNIGFRNNVVIGYINTSFKFNGIDLILNNLIMEEKNV